MPPPKVPDVDDDQGAGDAGAGSLPEGSVMINDMPEAPPGPRSSSRRLSLGVSSMTLRSQPFRYLLVMKPTYLELS